MQAAKKISLAQAGWTKKHQRAWEAVREIMMQAIVTSFRDRLKQAYIFTDASVMGWYYVITQCEPGELNKPWHEQRHELLAVNLGKFRNNQIWQVWSPLG